MGTMNDEYAFQWNQPWQITPDPDEINKGPFDDGVEVADGEAPF